MWLPPRSPAQANPETYGGGGHHHRSAGRRAGGQPPGRAAGEGRGLCLRPGMDQYKNHRGSDRQFYLSAWSNSPVSVDRKNLEEPIFLARPFVGVVGSIQPGVLPELIANRQGREGDGFLDRFLFSYPEPMLSRWSEDEISLEAVWDVRVLYERLREDLALEHNDNGDPRPREVRLLGETLARFREEVDALREEMEQSDFSNVLRGPWSKLEAYLARLSLVLAMARVVRGPAREGRVELEDVERATSLVEYFKAHARRAYLQLYGESREDKLLADLTKILKENQGEWEDDPNKGWEHPASNLYKALKVRGFDSLPPRGRAVEGDHGPRKPRPDAEGQTREAGKRKGAADMAGGASSTPGARCAWCP
jgi:hypothetical protein